MIAHMRPCLVECHGHLGRSGRQSGVGCSRRLPPIYRRAWTGCAPANGGPLFLSRRACCAREILSTLTQVAAWRCRGRLPLGVDVTASLLETRARCAQLLLVRLHCKLGSAYAVVFAERHIKCTCDMISGSAHMVLNRDTGLLRQRDTEAVDSLAAASENTLRMEFAMAIVRLVNGIADSAQKGKVAVSVASLASFAGKPGIRVQRHVCSVLHTPGRGTLPSCGPSRAFMF